MASSIQPIRDLSSRSKAASQWRGRSVIGLASSVLRMAVISAPPSPGNKPAWGESVPMEEATKTKKAYEEMRGPYRDPLVSVFGGSGMAMCEDLDIP
jgi:hypothetical protein